MPFAKLRQDYTPLPQAQPVVRPSADLDDFAPAHSPARALQQQLAQSAMVASAADADKWSPRRSLALIVTSSAALWLAILMAGAEASRMIA
jgi:hypothetical protein